MKVYWAGLAFCGLVICFLLLWKVTYLVTANEFFREMSLSDLTKNNNIIMVLSSI